MYVYGTCGYLDANHTTILFLHSLVLYEPINNAPTTHAYDLCFEYTVVASVHSLDMAFDRLINS